MTVDEASHDVIYEISTSSRKEGVVAATKRMSAVMDEELYCREFISDAAAYDIPTPLFDSH
jgi:hypothetical protein